MSNPEPIGFVSYGGGTILAELLDVDKWRVTMAGKDQPAMARTLGVLYQDHYSGPQDGYYGQLILADLAKQMDGVAVFLRQPPPEPYGTAY